MPTATRRHQQIAGHLQVRGEGNQRRYFASWWDENGKRRTTKLGGAHVKDSGRKTARGAVIWRTAPGSCPRGYLTPRMAEDALEALLDEARLAKATKPVESTDLASDAPTFGDAVDAWLAYLEVESAASTAPFGTHATSRTPTCCRASGPARRCTRSSARRSSSGGTARQFVETREERRDRFRTDDVDAYRCELLASELSPRTAQKVLVLLHGVFELAKRRKLIASNPSEDAERVSLEDPGTFNILEPIEFEALYRGVLGQQDERPTGERVDDEIDKLTQAERELYGAFLSMAFYAGPRLGELRDVPWRNVDFGGAMIRIETGFTEGRRSTPKGKRARSTPLVPILAQRLAALATRERFTGDDDYVFCTAFGERLGEKRIR